jgi:PRTRC genetic system protein C
MDIQNLQREFRYNGVALADPNQAFTLPQVRDFYSTVYPEITSADIEGPEQVGAKVIYTFRRAVGTKGAGLARDVALQRLRTGGSLAPGLRPANVITAEQAADPMARQIKQIVAQRASGGVPRCLAPSINHALLP